jgi:hypothetical protein
LTEIGIIRPGIDERDNCPVLTRIKAFIAYEGQTCILEYQFRDRIGNPIDLTSAVAISESGSEAISEFANSSDAALLRFSEFTAVGRPIVIATVIAEIVDARAGIVRAQVPKTIYGQSGIYRLSWAFIRDNDIVLINEGLLSMERSLFGFDTNFHSHTDGPPTINELRMQIMDSSPAENQYLLDDLEFNDDQIVLALTKPIQQFNEMPPPSRRYDTRNFPWKSAWLDAAVGFLFQFAAAHYRRNALNVQGGGQAVDDKAKEREYLAASQTLLAQWDAFRQLKKLQESMLASVSSFGSPYGRRNY